IRQPRCALWGVARDRIADVIEAALRFRRLRLLIRERSQAAWTPVDDVLAAVYQPLLEQSHERFADSEREIRLEREACACPVARAADRAQLLEDRRAGTVDELPHPLHERLAADVVARLPFRC